MTESELFARFPHSFSIVGCRFEGFGYAAKLVRLLGPSAYFYSVTPVGEASIYSVAADGAWIYLAGSYRFKNAEDATVAMLLL